MTTDIPDQITGAETNTEHSITLPNTIDAVEKYKVVCRRLLDVNNWKEICGTGSAEFQLLDANGEEVDRQAQLNDYFKIDIPGPGTGSGDGYDWVNVEKIDSTEPLNKEEQSFLMQVRPCSNPLSKTRDTSHFLSHKATSTFSVERRMNTITASVYGRNEIPNTKTHNVLDKIRNTIVGAGAVAGESKIQWTLLVKGLLK